MGKCAEATRATKELKKQFKKTTQKKITKHDQRIIDAVQNSDFGCQKEKAFVFAEAILNRKVNRFTRDSDRFNAIVGSVMVRLIDCDMKAGTVCVVERVDSQGCPTTWNVYDGQSQELHSWTNDKASWRPATDKEIREYFA